MTKRQLMINISLILSKIFSKTVKNSKYTLFGSCTGETKNHVLCAKIFERKNREM